MKLQKSKIIKSKKSNCRKTFILYIRVTPIQSTNKCQYNKYKTNYFNYHDIINAEIILNIFGQLKIH